MTIFELNTLVLCQRKQPCTRKSFNIIYVYHSVIKVAVQTNTDQINTFIVKQNNKLQAHFLKH